ncbi:hypothetical protein LR004_03100, partial [Candidatus Gracilibacteria bacterium]|nr:hypothetical protein [Candidatus Gracilibacteria bacterium]
YFGIITILLGIFAFLSGTFGFLFGFLFIVYGGIFLILLAKLIKRSFYYLYISNVVFTNKGIILGDKLHLYKDDTDLEKKLLDYEDMFDEYLSKPSKLEQVILKKRSEVLDGTTKTGKKVFDVMGKIDMGHSKESGQLAIMVMLSYAIYTVLLYVFYYVGYFFGYLMFYFVSLFLKVIFYFKENTEIKIKQKVEGLENSFVKMKKIDEILSHKISNFKDGEISQISGFVQEHFSNFYSEILLALRERTKLLKIIEDSQYKEFIDFDLLEKYIKSNFNKPVNEMVSMLDKFEKMLETGLKNVKTIQSNKSEYDAHMKKKEMNLEKQLESLQNNKTKLQQTII